MIGEWAKREGRIHFAGDFSTPKTDWVEGANPAAKPEAEPGLRQKIKG